MTKNHIKLLDMDEHQRSVREAIAKEHMEDILAVCERFDLTLDLASSDAVMFLEDSRGNNICLL